MKRPSRSLPFLLACAVAGCPSAEKQPGILVNIALAPGLASKCTQLIVRAGGSETRSDAVVLAGKTTVTVAVAQGGLPATVSFQAAGFADERCQMRSVPAESSDAVSGTFVKNTIIEVTLRLAPEVSDTENCNNGRDDDGDSFIDCRDPDCASKPCTGGDQCFEGKICQTGVCSGGTARACNVPPSQCFLTAGSCQSADAGCVYPVRAGAACDDANGCTSADSCSATGVCVGTSKVCNAPPSQCFSAGSCGADGGCEYGLAVGATCNDNSTCTIADRCAPDGGCGGTPVMCAPKQCASLSSGCFDDGGCDYMPASAGSPCESGVCNGSSSCVPNFPYTPSNFILAQVPPPPASGTVITCADTVINTSTSPPSVTSSCGDAGGVAFGWVVLPSGEQKAVMLMSFQSLTVTAGASVTFVGERAPVLAVLGDAQIGGLVTARAGARTCGGPNNGTGKNSNAGGGGGGYGVIGAGGGQWSNNAGGAGGSSEGEATLVPLRGGCSGGLGRMNSGPAMGGGALQISAKGTLTLTGFVGAPGAGGAGGPSVMADFRGGNGGGSGGAVLLEANAITVSASGGVTANGGGGGEGNDLLAFAGMSGSSGLVASAAQAPGGTGMSDGGAGGNGGSAGNAATGGGDTSDGIGGGGGGGGVGRIRFNTVNGCTVPGGAVLSPAPTTSQPCM